MTNYLDLEGTRKGPTQPASQPKGGLGDAPRECMHALHGIIVDALACARGSK